MVKVESAGFAEVETEEVRFLCMCSSVVSRDEGEKTRWGKGRKQGKSDVGKKERTERAPRFEEGWMTAS